MLSIRLVNSRPVVLLLIYTDSLYLLPSASDRCDFPKKRCRGSDADLYIRCRTSNHPNRTRLRSTLCQQWAFEGLCQAAPQRSTLLLACPASPSTAKGFSTSLERGAPRSAILSRVFGACGTRATDGVSITSAAFDA